MMSNPDQPSRRRSDTILATKRRLLKGDGEKPFKILALDRGGIKGIFPAIILTWREKHCQDNPPIGDYFDLIAGPSTGGIIALGLAAGRQTPLRPSPRSRVGPVFPPRRYKWLPRF